MWAAREPTQTHLESLRLYYGNHTHKPVAWLKRIDIAAEVITRLTNQSVPGKKHADTRRVRTDA